ncbi:DUF86 domain-containing protein [Ilyomonas limi]|uniref:DUF86 domain-containing protein n=1 Tax=Ilyomonas limi TaxID=2575867 RepID=A0A4U3KRM9_9BACT|nr:DUF86 domain-containing protein [Ilyomonas limi]
MYTCCSELRNRIIHAHDNVNDVLIWKIATKDIPVLEIDVNRILENEIDE